MLGILYFMTGRKDIYTRTERGNNLYLIHCSSPLTVTSISAQKTRIMAAHK